MGIRSWAHRIALLALVGAAPTSVEAAGREAEGASAEKQRALEHKVEVLTEEVQALREQMVLPEKKEDLESYHGMGPAASKIYGVDRGISFGGYGEFYLQKLVGDINEGEDFNIGDFLRYVQYVGYKFTDWLLVNAELELEHSTTGSNFQGKGGSVSLEFAYIDALLDQRVNIRAGLLLLPVGWINELHEPPFFHGNLRPEVERAIIPSTWRELGIGLFGEIVPGLRYKLYLVNGLDGGDFSASGWRDGRQKGGRVLAEDYAGVLRLDYDWRSIVTVGGSVYYGGADQDRLDDTNANTLLLEGHAQLRYRGLELRALGAYGHLSNARAFTLYRFPDAPAGEDPETRLIGSHLFGWYAEAAYDFWPLITRHAFYLAPFVRFEMFDSQARVPTVAGRIADDNQQRWIVDAGVSFKPHPQVVLKVNYREVGTKGDAQLADSFFFGAGFVY